MDLTNNASKNSRGNKKPGTAGYKETFDTGGEIVGKWKDNNTAKL